MPCKEIGTYTVVFVGKGKYHGEIRVKFNITGVSIATAKIAAIDPVVYDNTAKEPTLYVTDKSGDAIYLHKDYEVIYENNVNAGSAKVTIMGIGKYFGKVVRTFKINQLAVDNLDSSVMNVAFAGGSDTVAYEKAGAKPKVVVTYNNGKETITLNEITDYSVVYRYNTSVVPVNGKTPELTVTLKKNFKGKKIVGFNIKKADISKLEISVPDMVEGTLPGRYMSVPVVTDINGRKLVKNVDYESNIIYKDLAGNVLDKNSKPVAGDIVSVVITGKNNYEGYAFGSFRIFAKGMTVATARVVVKPESASKLIYTGQPVTLTQADLTVSVGKDVLSNSDYRIIESSYTNNLNKGAAKVTIVGKGQYAGMKTITFTVKPQTISWWK